MVNVGVDVAAFVRLSRILAGVRGLLRRFPDVRLQRNARLAEDAGIRPPRPAGPASTAWSRCVP
jgi:hypothetical protein